VAAIGVAAFTAELARTRIAWLAAVLATAVLIPPAARVAGVAHDPTTWSDIRPLLQAVHSQLRPGDVVWAHAEDAPSAEYYAISTGAPLTGALYDAPPGATCPGSPGLADAAAGRRVWFVYGYHASTASPAEEDVLYARMATVAHLEATIARPQATAWLWDFGAAPDASAPAADAGVLGCVGVVPVAVRPSGLHDGPLGSGPAT